MVSVKDIAQEAGVSVRTVCRVLKNNGYASADVRERVEQAAQRLGYKPNRNAQSLRLNTSHEIGVLAWSADEIHTARLAAFERRLRKDHFTTAVIFAHDLPENPERTLAALEDLRPAAAALFVWPEMTKTFCRRINGLDCPAIIFDGRPEHAVDMVSVDRARGVHDAVHYLAECGRRRIAYLGLTPQEYAAYLADATPGDACTQASYANQTRLNGYHAALRELDRPALYLEPGRAWTSEWYDAGFAAAKKMVASGTMPDAVQAFSDELAAGFLAGLNSLGVRVPDDIALIGFDNRHLAAFCSPRLTTIAQPNEEVGIAAAEILLARIAGEPAPEAGWSRCIVPHLIKRETA